MARVPLLVFCPPSPARAERRLQRRRRPPSSARRGQTLQLPGEPVETAWSNLFRISGSSATAEAEEPQRLRQRAAQEAAMRLFRLRRWVVTPALGLKVGATAAAPTPAALPELTVPATRCRPPPPPAERADKVVTTMVSEAAPPRWPMRRRPAAERRLPRRSRRASRGTPSPSQGTPMQRRTPRL